MTAAFSLAASAFFPTLVGGVFWRRANRHGAVAAMITGLTVSGIYIAASHPAVRGVLGLAQPLSWFDIDPIAAGVFGVPAGAMALFVVSLLTAAPGPDERAVFERLHTPESTRTAPVTAEGL